MDAQLFIQDFKPSGEAVSTFYNCNSMNTHASQTVWVGVGGSPVNTLSFVLSRSPAGWRMFSISSLKTFVQCYQNPTVSHLITSWHEATFCSCTKTLCWRTESEAALQKPFVLCFRRLPTSAEFVCGGEDTGAHVCQTHLACQLQVRN